MEQVKEGKVPESLVDRGASRVLAAKLRLGLDMTPIEALIGKGKAQVTMAEVPSEEAAHYAAADADVTLRLMQHQGDGLDTHGVRKLFDEVELPLVPVLVDMELAGVAGYRLVQVQLG